MNEINTDVKTTPKDFFLNLGSIVTLYISTISFISLVYVIINYFFPDLLTYYYDGGRDTIRWTVSCLVVLFPLYIFLTKLINKDIAVFPAKKNLWIKKWSVYLTLFLTGATVAVDLIILLNFFLGGEITTRFILKVIAVLLTALYVFLVYLHDLKRTDYGKDNWVVFTTGVGTLLILGAIITGFFIVGSPSSERDRRFDDQRVNDLSTIQSYLVNTYWTNTGTLPENLSELNDPVSSFMVPVDPETGMPYEYRVTGTNSFELCAEFSLPSREIAEKARFESIDQSFPHDAGQTCFERIIDPRLYPVNASSTRGL